MRLYVLCCIVAFIYATMARSTSPSGTLTMSSSQSLSATASVSAEVSRTFSLSLSSTSSITFSLSLSTSSSITFSATQSITMGATQSATASATMSSTESSSMSTTRPSTSLEPTSSKSRESLTAADTESASVSRSRSKLTASAQLSCTQTHSNSVKPSFTATITPRHTAAPTPTATMFPSSTRNTKSLSETSGVTLSHSLTQEAGSRSASSSGSSPKSVSLTSTSSATTSLSLTISNTTSGTVTLSECVSATASSTVTPTITPPDTPTPTSSLSEAGSKSSTWTPSNPTPTHNLTSVTVSMSATASLTATASLSDVHSASASPSPSPSSTMPTPVLSLTRSLPPTSTHSISDSMTLVISLSTTPSVTSSRSISLSVTESLSTSLTLSLTSSTTLQVTTSETIYLSYSQTVSDSSTASRSENTTVTVTASESQEISATQSMHSRSGSRTATFSPTDSDEETMSTTQTPTRSRSTTDTPTRSLTISIDPCNTTFRSNVTSFVDHIVALNNVEQYFVPLSGEEQSMYALSIDRARFATIKEIPLKIVLTTPLRNFYNDVRQQWYIAPTSSLCRISSSGPVTRDSLGLVMKYDSATILGLGVREDYACNVTFSTDIFQCQLLTNFTFNFSVAALIRATRPVLSDSSVGLVSSIASGVATVMATTSMLGQSRAASFMALADCQFSIVDVLEFPDNIFSLAIGTKENGYQRGAVVGNLAFLAGFTLVMLLFISLYWIKVSVQLRSDALLESTLQLGDISNGSFGSRQHVAVELDDDRQGSTTGEKQSNEKAAPFSGSLWVSCCSMFRFPGILIVPISLLFDGTLSSGVSLVSHPRTSVDLPLGIAVLALGLILVGWLAWVTIITFNLKRVRPSKDGAPEIILRHRLLKYLLFPKSEWSSKRLKGKERKGDGALGAQVGNSEHHGSDDVSSVPPSKVAVMHHMKWFIIDDWIYPPMVLADFVSSYTIGVVIGIGNSNRSVCMYMAVASAIPLAAQCGLLIYFRPIATRLSLWFVIAINVMCLVSAVLTIVAMLTASLELQAIPVFITFGVMLLSSVKSVIDIAVLLLQLPCIRHHREETVVANADGSVGEDLNSEESFDPLQEEKKLIVEKKEAKSASKTLEAILAAPPIQEDCEMRYDGALASFLAMHDSEELLPLRDLGTRTRGLPSSLPVVSPTSLPSFRAPIKSVAVRDENEARGRGKSSSPPIEANSSSRASSMDDPLEVRYRAGSAFIHDDLFASIDLMVGLDTAPKGKSVPSRPQRRGSRRRKSGAENRRARSLSSKAQQVSREHNDSDTEQSTEQSTSSTSQDEEVKQELKIMADLKSFVENGLRGLGKKTKSTGVAGRRMSGKRDFLALFSDPESEGGAFAVDSQLAQWRGGEDFL